MAKRERINWEIIGGGVIRKCSALQLAGREKQRKCGREGTERERERERERRTHHNEEFAHEAHVDCGCCLPARPVLTLPVGKPVLSVEGEFIDCGRFALPCKPISPFPPTDILKRQTSREN